MTAYQDLIPKFIRHNRPQIKKNTLTNGEIREILIKLNSKPVKSVAWDFGRAVLTIYKIRNNYVLVRGHLYRRIEDGN